MPAKREREFVRAVEYALSQPSWNYHLRELESVVFTESTIPLNLRNRLLTHYVPKLVLTGYKIPEKREIALQCLRALVLCGLSGRAVADTRDRRNPGVRLRVSIWDLIEAAGWLEACIGSEESGKQTRYLATEELLAEFRTWNASDLVNQQFQRSVERDEMVEDALIVLKDANKNPIPLPANDLAYKIVGETTVRDHLRSMEARLEFINSSNLRHTWTRTKARCSVDGTLRRSVCEVSVALRQIHSRCLLRCARNYTGTELSAQALSKQERRWVTIDGEKVAEHDFGCFLTRMLYHCRGLDPDPSEDLYQPRKIMPKFHRDRGYNDYDRELVRGLIKDATNICWNTKSLAKAAGATREKIKTHEQSEFLWEVLRLENITPTSLIERIVAAHPELGAFFFTEVGAGAMTLDGMLMLNILATFAHADKPALGLHDGILCKAEDAQFARRTMRNSYRKMFGFYPVVNREF